MSEVSQKAKLAKRACKDLNLLSLAQKNKLLNVLADSLIENSSAIIKANLLDLNKGRKKGLSLALLDRLALDEKRLRSLAQSIKDVAELPDPLGKILWETTRPNGLKIQKVSVPMGVIGVIYEARPNVTADAAVLCLKAGSTVVLRGGSDAANSNQAIVSAFKQAIKKAGSNPDIVQLIESTDRKLVSEMLTLNKYIDLLIPRGGAALIQKVVKEATVPVIETGTGNCHVYVDISADLEKALKIAFNAKVQRPSVCNAAETLLVHKDIAKEFLPKIIDQYLKAGVLIHGCPQTKKFNKSIKAATEKDYYTEYLALEIAIKVVKDIDEAIEHINTYNSKHTEAIVAEDTAAQEKFSREIDAAAIMVNTSTRFTDGGEFGFGCELGISNQKLHARGPMGLPEITTYKYIVCGDGQIRN